MMSTPVGCDVCAGIGYRGRVAIIEFLKMTDSIRALIMARAEAGEIFKLAVKEGMLTMSEDGMFKVIEGITTPEEVMSHVSTDNITSQSHESSPAISLSSEDKNKIDI